MLKRIEIQNFQSHKNTILNLHKGVNVFVGDSDCGKSALLRSLRWAIENKSESSSIIRYGEKSVSVSLVFDDATVTRSRDNSGNVYELTSGKNTETFKAFKTEIPQAVNEALNLSDINLQSQLEAPFLLSQSGGEVAKVLNSSVNLSIIHESLSNIKKEVFRNNQEIVSTQAQITETEEALEGFSYLAGLEKKIKAYESKAKEKIELETQITELYKTLKKAQQHQTDIDSFSELPKAEKKVDSILADIEAHSELYDKRVQLNKIIKQSEISEYTIAFSECLLELEGNVNEILEVTDGIVKLEKAIKTLIRTSDSVEGYEEEIGKLETEYIEEAPDTCPLCGHEMLEVEQ